MTHEEWLVEMKEALAHSGRHAGDAIVRLKRLASTAARAERRVVGGWHVEQALGTAAAMLAKAGHRHEAARLLKRLARRHEGALRYHGHALASALTSAALELFEAGASAVGARLARRGIHYYGQFPEPSFILEEVLRHLRAYEQQRAARRGRSRS